jgi:hypothetical protein
MSKIAYGEAVGGAVGFGAGLGVSLIKVGWTVAQNPTREAQLELAREAVGVTFGALGYGIEYAVMEAELSGAGFIMAH